jgi:hypothetical protein
MDCDTILKLSSSGAFCSKCDPPKEISHLSDRKMEIIYLTLHFMKKLTGKIKNIETYNIICED